jgi:hAT family C-terminal dimerisation region
LIFHSTGTSNLGFSAADHGYSEHIAKSKFSSSSKKLRLEDDLTDWRDDDSSVAFSQEDEVYLYSSKVFTDDLTNACSTVVDGEESFDVAKFWCNTEVKQLYPFLSRVAIGILSIPASSASSERVFSTAGRVVEKRRNKLSSKSVDSLLFLHSKHCQA